jgi:hypothetical protein
MSSQGVEVVTILCTSSGPGSASLAASWQSQFGLNHLVWGDTTDYMYSTFTGPQMGGLYPSTMVIDLDTMTLRAFAQGGYSAVTNTVDQILNEPHPCADL